MKMFSKLLPMSLLVALIQTQGGMVEEKYDDMIDDILVVVTQFELRNLHTAVSASEIGGEEITEANFADFVRDNMVAQFRADTALDFWGQAYELSTNSEEMTITSAGPDEMMGSEDDITVTVIRTRL